MAGAEEEVAKGRVQRCFGAMRRIVGDVYDTSVLLGRSEAVDCWKDVEAFLTAGLSLLEFRF